MSALARWRQDRRDRHDLAVLGALATRRHLSGFQLAILTGLRASQVYAALERLADAGHVHPLDAGRRLYTLTAAGRGHRMALARRLLQDLPDSHIAVADRPDPPRPDWPV